MFFEIGGATAVKPFAEVALLLALAALLGLGVTRLRQPVLIAYLLLGLVVGPSGLALTEAHAQIDLLAQVGVAVLLFLVGLKLDVKAVREIGPVALAAGSAQMVLTVGAGLLLLALLGFGWLEAIYLAVALAFSSTIIIIKLLSDKRELDSLHGRVTVGILIVQDIAVVVAMMAMGSLRVGEGAPTWAVAADLGLKLLALVGFTWVTMRWVLPTLLPRLAESLELLLIFALGWGTGLAALGEWAGFSREVGAFLAGFTLASTPWRDAIASRLTSVRDFLLLFFFIDLGGKFDLALVNTMAWEAAVLSCFVLLGKPLVVMAIMGYMGFSKRTGALAGVSLAQISEFSILFVAMGVGVGHVGAETLGLTTLVGLITIAVSSYMILYSHVLYGKLARFLWVFERQVPFREAEEVGPGPAAPSAPEVVVLGAGRYGEAFAEALQQRGIEVLAVEFDPENARIAQRAGIPVQFGDAEAVDFLAELPLSSVRWVVSTLPSPEATETAVGGLRALGFTGGIAVVARSDEEEARLAAIPGVEVIHPLQQAATFAALDLAARIVSAKAHTGNG
ncbi:MAG: cation:proton antiporter [Hydrogenophilus sp.]|nr:cation:proton antiporter [Hydrogenophilus sp.]